MKGKATLIHFWATWLGDGHWELESVQKLIEQLKNDDSVLVLTFNLDSNQGLIEPYLKEHSLDVPVILARPFVEKKGPFGVPRNWVIAAEGVLQFEWFDIETNPDARMKRALRRIEKAKR